MSELGIIARHAGTVLIGQLAVIAFGVADTLIAGRYSPQALAVLSLASSIYISIYVALNGLMQALLPVWSELRGAGQKAALGRSVRQALYLCLAVSLLGTIALLWPDPWLNATQVPLALQADVRAYLQVLAVAVGPSLLFRMYATLNQSLGMPLRVTTLQIAALGIKIRKGCSYHGLSLNVAMDLKPFLHINPCGYAGLETVDLATIGVKISQAEMQMHLMKYLIQHLEAARSAVAK